MLFFIYYKIKNKKLLTSALLLGVSLLVGFFCIYPMFLEGSLKRLLHTSFVDYAVEENVYPSVITKNIQLDIETFRNAKEIYQSMEQNEDIWTNQVDCPVRQRQNIVMAFSGNLKSGLESKVKTTYVGMIPDMQQHCDLMKGVWLEDVEKSDNPSVQEALNAGAYPCLLSQKGLDKLGVIVGDTFLNPDSDDSTDRKGSFVVVGIIEEKFQDDYFWHTSLSTYDNTLWVTEETFDQLIEAKTVFSYLYTQNLLLDYNKMDYKKVPRFIENLNAMLEEDDSISCNFKEIMEGYLQKAGSIRIILFTYELPIVVLLVLFLYMISSRILEMESTEIAMLKSRGLKRGKIFTIYLLQSFIIAFIGGIIGLFIGTGMCYIAASANGFLQFGEWNTRNYSFTPAMFLFAFGGMVVSILFMTIPVISLSRMTITERRNKKVQIYEKPLWEKWFWDLILLLISSYLLYNYNKQKELLSIQILSGGGLDPVMFLDASLFVFSLGLLSLRLVGYLVRFVYFVNKKRWKPDSYIAFLQIIRNSKKMGFISVFLVMTVAMGIFHANLARTVNENTMERLTYNLGCDLQVSEEWPLSIMQMNSGEAIWNYKEPDFSRYDVLNDQGVVEKTKVIRDDNIDITVNNKVEKGNTLMAVHTKEFGETAILSGELNDQHWFHYLNALAKHPNGVLISKNLADKYGVKEGEEIRISRYAPMDDKKTYHTSKMTVRGILDAFPGFESITYEMGEGGAMEKRERFLVVANYATIVNNFGKTPYSVWMRLDKEKDATVALDTLSQGAFRIQQSDWLQGEMEAIHQSAMIQITNGVFSVGFMISLLICVIGYLIYWTLTLKEREMYYGIYRAMGMSLGEIAKMLVIEQLFSSLLAVLAGFGVGMITTSLFAKLITIIYLPGEHNLPIQIFIDPQDGMKIGMIVLLAFVICFMIMRKYVRRLNISKALKLGED